MLRDDRGQTLPELMIATVIGLIVVFAAFLLLDQAVNQNTNITAREDASQRGRLAMEELTRELRSQVCLDQVETVTDSFGVKHPNETVTNPAIVDGENQSITFYDDLSGGAQPPMKRVIAYNQSKLTLTEAQYPGTGFPPSTTYSGTPAKTITLLSNVVPVGGLTSPIFHYYPLNATGTTGVSTTPIAPPVTSDTTVSPVTGTAGSVADIRVTFVVHGITGLGTASPTSASANQFGSTFDNDVVTRTADPTQPLLGANCS